MASMAEIEIGMSTRSKEEGARLLRLADQRRKLLEERRVEALKDKLVNECGESLDALQSVWKPPATNLQTFSQNVAEYAGVMQRSESEEGRRRQNLQLAMATDAKIQKLALSESLRDTDIFMSQHAKKLSKAASALPFGSSFIYRDLFHTEEVPEGVAPVLDACQGIA